VMREAGPVAEDEVILAFLKAEIDSPRFGPIYAGILQNSGLNRTALIERANLSSDADNRTRLELLKTVRGYRANEYLFRGFPADPRWRRVDLTPADIGNLKYANFPTWTQLSGGTRLVADGARNVDRIQTAENANANIEAVAKAVAAGQRYPELITAEANDGALILVEGHTRATAYVVAALPEPVACFVGSSPRMRTWAFY
jgi:hypothetical protein